MKLYIFFPMILCATFLSAQTLVDFEEFNLSPESPLNGSDGNGGFTSGDIFLPNDFNSEFMSWSGWAISNTTDVTTPGFTNGFSAIAGGGFDGSAHYAVNFGAQNNMILQGNAAGQPVSGMYITNNTYAYLSMQDGDTFAKKFGGVTGDDPDFFRLTIKAFLNGNLSTDSVNFYLADYRFSNNSQDYIVDEWTWVNLSSLGDVDSLSFTLTSSDVGQFGMNTPAYFCVDNIFSTNPTTSITAINAPDLFEIYPNPTTDYIQIFHSENKIMHCYIFDTNGKLLQSEKLNSNGRQVYLQSLPPGHYVVKVQNGQVFSSKIVEKK